MKTVNPFKHAFPHAKLYNVTLIKIGRLTRMPEPSKTRNWFIANDDARNFSISRAGELKKAA